MAVVPFLAFLYAPPPRTGAARWPLFNFRLRDNLPHTGLSFWNGSALKNLRLKILILVSALSAGGLYTPLFYLVS